MSQPVMVSIGAEVSPLLGPWAGTGLWPARKWASQQEEQWVKPKSSRHFLGPWKIVFHETGSLVPKI